MNTASDSAIDELSRTLTQRELDDARERSQDQIQRMEREQGLRA